MGDAEALKKQRGSCESALTRLARAAKKVTADSADTVDELHVMANRAHELLEKIIALEGQIFVLDKKEESHLLEADEVYCAAVSKFNEGIRVRSMTNLNTTVGGANNATMNATADMSGIKLAKVQIPSFSGNYEEWQSLFDLFCSSIHDKENIPTVQKFHYMMGLLKVEAYLLVRQTLH